MSVASVAVEPVLTEQEKREADQLCLTWQTISAEAGKLVSLSADVEEIVLTCYESVRKKSSAVSSNLQGVASAVDQIAVESRKWNANPMVQDAKKTSLLGREPPAWYQRGLSALVKQFDRIALKIKGGFPLINLLTNSVEVVPMGQLGEALRFFQHNSQQLDGLENDLRDTRKTMCALLAKKTEEFGNVRRAIFDALCVWAGASSARVEYLRCKGINVVALGIQCVNNHTTSSEPAQSARRQKAEIASRVEPEQMVGKKPEEQHWMVFCLNHTGNILTQFLLLMSDNGKALAEILKEKYNRWSPSGDITIRVLRGLINQTPAERNMGTTIRFRDINWYRLVVGKKYRMMVHIKDDTRVILLMAGHRTDLYTKIGKSKNEA